MRILVEKLIEECIKTVKEVKHFENNHKCSSDTLHFVLFSILFTINVGIGTYIFFCIATSKKILLRLCLILVPKQQFTRFSFVKLMNGISPTNRDHNLNLIFLQRHDQVQSF